jgi:hypothetical protein
MKTIHVSPATAPLQQPRRGARKLQPRPQRGRLEGAGTAESRAQQKAGAYKRLEIFLGVEAAIALRQLMRDGRSARDVVEALLVAEKRRRREHGSP